jgi:hypothetical protein
MQKVPVPEGEAADDAVMMRGRGSRDSPNSMQQQAQDDACQCVLDDPGVVETDAGTRAGRFSWP